MADVSGLCYQLSVGQARPLFVFASVAWAMSSPNSISLRSLHDYFFRVNPVLVGRLAAREGMCECNGFHLVTCSRAGGIRRSGRPVRVHICSNQQGRSRIPLNPVPPRTLTENNCPSSLCVCVVLAALLCAL